MSADTKCALCGAAVRTDFGAVREFLCGSTASPWRVTPGRRCGLAAQSRERAEWERKHPVGTAVLTRWGVPAVVLGYEWVSECARVRAAFLRPSGEVYYATPAEIVRRIPRSDALKRTYYRVLGFGQAAGWGVPTRQAGMNANQTLGLTEAPSPDRFAAS